MKTKHKVGDRVTVSHEWWGRGEPRPAIIFKIFSGHQAIVITEDGGRHKITLGRCSEPLTAAEYFKQILLYSP